MEDPLVTKELDNEDKVLKSLLDTFGSAFSLREIASAFCKAGRDATLVGDILCGMRTGPSADATHVSKELIYGGISSKALNYNDFDESCYTNRNNSKASKLKSNPASVGSNSNVVGKDYVWHIAGSNKSPDGTTPVKVKAASVATVSNVRGQNCICRIAGSNGTHNGTKALKVEANSFAIPVNTSEEPLLSRDANLSSSERSSSANGTHNGTKPLKVEANSFAIPVNTSEEPLLSRDANLSSSERSLSASDVSLNDDIENFLFEMLGHGSQLERSAIREVLGHCGYDMKKSLETLLDLMAVNLDRKNNMSGGSNLHSNSKSLSSENQVQKQKSAESNGNRTTRNNSIPSRQTFERYERADLTGSAPVPESATRSRATRALVPKPLKDVAEDCEVKTTSPNLYSMKDDAEEGSYCILRKAVKEHRETMKEYYKAAAEAFARGDRGRATLCLEKGQFFHNKAREADEESASKIFETSDSSGDGELREEISLDLQDHDPKEAIRLVKLHLRTLSGIPLVSDLKIIIGNGDQDAEKRKRLISKLFQKEAIKWTEDETSGTILIRLDEINPKSLSFGRK